MTVILIDGKNALYRFGYTFMGFQSSEGVKTGAIYGLFNVLLRLKKKYPDAKFVMVWDGAGKGWRYNVFPEYKANRKKTKSPEVLAVLEQIPTVQRLTNLLGIPAICVPRMEADDIIGLLAVRCLKNDWKPVVYSSDKDFMQLMHMGVKVIRDVDKTNKLAAESIRTVKAKFGCTPEFILKIRAIAGDKSDGIPNPVPGIGPMKAARIVEAGVDPSQSDFHGHYRPQGVAAILGPMIESLHQEWDSVHRNYRIMSILTSVHHPEVGAADRHFLRLDLSRVMRELKAAYKSRGKVALRKFVSVLQELEMTDALASRHELWRLQRPTSGAGL